MGGAGKQDYRRDQLPIHGLIVDNMVTVDGPAQGCFALYTLLGLFVGRLVTIGASGTG